ncbi:unnamed protein product [Phytophthora lilii]|uniref:Unnamed protein product n=1 Tax=Phytophthora lilii TaxID=2077276 RepID=A0A9W6WMR9_9STRA|nr:unnamed protein product [Phytophthora lilii]
MTPRTVQLEKLRAKHALAITFGIVPAPPDSTFTSTAVLRGGVSPKLRQTGALNENGVRENTLADFQNTALETTQLAPALTPRNAYQNAVNRQFILSMRQPDSSANPEDLAAT